MTYAQVVNFLNKPPSLAGRVVRAYVAQYSFVALLLDTDEVIAFATSEVCVGKWFEVFPISLYQLPPDYEFEWIELDEPLAVASTVQIWREEWQEAVENHGQLLGSGPNSLQCSAALGEAPKTAGMVVKVNAGMQWIGPDGRSLLICSSEASPFKINSATDIQGIQEIMKHHTFQ
ncbi:hypothetical protein [Undibacterium terreum]|uniref:Uncharacterized protein n=1 Tax=Undibacterium terreum TaxID=1224302 RepID=A0A916UBR3_9BURK|nr:hypothetical protein [Undibacterium terreum]GGC65197.1 hypothetical protein GCM10011396_10250 [Undibacterium terreum]